jgi:uncharacterized protein with GYD domain
MAMYALLVRSDPYAATQMLLSGSDGAAAQQQTVRAYGGSVTGQYVLSGRYDQLLLVDFADEFGVRAMVLAAAAHGQIIEDMRAFTPQEMNRVRELADQTARAVETQAAANPTDAATGQ